MILKLAFGYARCLGRNGQWAPDIFGKDGLLPYYTGSDTNNNQAIGLATSPDLFAWEKYAGNPVVCRVIGQTHVGKDVAGRDAMVFEDKPTPAFFLHSHYGRWARLPARANRLT